MLAISGETIEEEERRGRRGRGEAKLGEEKKNRPTKPY